MQNIHQKSAPKPSSPLVCFKNSQYIVRCYISGVASLVKKKKKTLEIYRINCEWVPKFSFAFVVEVEGGVG